MLCDEGVATTDVKSSPTFRAPTPEELRNEPQLSLDLYGELGPWGVPP